MIHTLYSSLGHVAVIQNGREITIYAFPDERHISSRPLVVGLYKMRTAAGSTSIVSLLRPDKKISVVIRSKTDSSEPKEYRNLYTQDKALEYFQQLCPFEHLCRFTVEAENEPKTTAELYEQCRQFLARFKKPASACTRIVDRTMLYAALIFMFFSLAGGPIDLFTINWAFCTLYLFFRG